VRRSGFAFLEAIVSAGILGLVAGAAYGAAAADLRAAHHADVALRASAVAEYRMATIAVLDARAVRALPDSVACGRFAAPFAGAQPEAALHLALVLTPLAPQQHVHGTGSHDVRSLKSVAVLL
jgi:hypothetical protein